MATMTLLRARRGDGCSLAILVALPLLSFGLPAVLGHPLLPGDDLLQNYPLRVLVGEQLRHGQWPLWNPFDWGGSPLLAGFNAGAAYPLTALFAVLPKTAAWALGEMSAYWCAGIGVYAFLRLERLRPAPALLAGFTFACAGAMPVQLEHLGLVQGLGLLPWLLIAVRQLAAADRLGSRAGWAAALGALGALVVLAGDPRAMSDAVIVLIPFVCWQVWRLRRAATPGRVAWFLASVGVAGVAGLLLAAVQLLPGIAYLDLSQRSAAGYQLFASGSLPPRWLSLLAIPDVLGGSGSFGLPRFAGSYNFAEVSGYLGLLPWCAAAGLAFAGRRSIGRHAIWFAVVALGLLLALGGSTPLGHLLAGIPGYGSQRLQSRNLAITDLALSLLLGYWLDSLANPAARTRRQALASAAPAAAVLALALVGMALPGRLVDALGGPARLAKQTGGLTESYAISAILALLVTAAVYRGRRWAAHRQLGSLAVLVVLDTVSYLALVAVSLSPATISAAATVSHAATATRAGPASGTLAPTARFAVYDPTLTNPAGLAELGQPDENILRAVSSVQGYGSLVADRYAGATGTHTAFGAGQATLSAAAVQRGVLDQLGLRQLYLPPTDLLAGRAPATMLVVPGSRQVWYFGQPVDLAGLAFPGGWPAGSRVGLLLGGGGVRFAARGETPTGTGVGIVLVDAGTRAVRVGPPSVRSTTGARYRLGGVWQAALQPPRFRYAGDYHGFAVFDDTQAAPPLRVLPVPAGEHVSLRTAGCPGYACTQVRVVASVPATLVRAVSFAPGWQAMLLPASGAVRDLPVVRHGLVQAVSIPAGHYLLRFDYRPASVTLAGRLAVAGLLLLAILLAAAVVESRWPHASTVASSRAGHRADPADIIGSTSANNG